MPSTPRMFRQRSHQRHQHSRQLQESGGRSPTRSENRPDVTQAPIIDFAADVLAMGNPSTAIASRGSFSTESSDPMLEEVFVSLIEEGCDLGWGDEASEWSKHKEPQIETSSVVMRNKYATKRSRKHVSHRAK